MNDFILADFNLAAGWSIRQTAKFNSPPNFLAIRYAVSLPIVLNGLRRSEDGWVFEDPVTEAIAPGYFDVIEKPMDFCTVEKKLEGSQYKAKQEVGVLVAQHYIPLC